MKKIAFWWNQITDLKSKLAKAIKDKNLWKERVDDIEYSLERNYGIKVRVNKVEVNSDFSKIELVVMQSGIDLVLKNSKNSNDILFYAKLKLKIQKVLDDMEG